MSDSHSPPPAPKAASGNKGAGDKNNRLAQALRDNLYKRKELARERSTTSDQSSLTPRQRGLTPASDV